MAKRLSLFKPALTVLYGICLACFFYFLIVAMPYYATPMVERPLHPDYVKFKPAGTYGLLFGVVGSVFMFSLLLYSLRKRTRIFGKLFTIKRWLDVHILFGVMGPCFILLHTSFKLGGLVAVSFWSMMAVALSGLFGRYLYIQIPRNIRGEELGVRELEAQDRELGVSLQTKFGLSSDQVDEMMDTLNGGGDKSNGLFWLHMITGDLKRQWRMFRARKTLPARYNISPQYAAALIEAAGRKSTMKRRIARLERVHKLFHYWHVIHRPFALIMYIIMIIHIVIALLFGISWRAGLGGNNVLGLGL